MPLRPPAGYVRPGYDPLEVADAPQSPSASAGNESASVSFTAPSDTGGSAITNYYAVSNPGQITNSSVTSPVSVTGLTNGTEYTFTVWAENSYGPSPYSVASGSVTPAPPFIEDVFSTWLYTGNGSTQTITNGIDLAGEGGLVWTKRRGGAVANSHILIDTARGQDKGLNTDGTGAQTSGWYPTFFTGFTSTGYGIAGAAGENNASTSPYASWTFRKAEKFFDVVTYTGTGVARTIAHNLGSVPGCIIVKRTDTSADWQVYHRANTAAPETDYLVLNSTAATVDSNTRWNDTLPTSTVFSLGTEATVNASGGTYVAYLFAHNAGGFGDDGQQNVISCGSFTGTGSLTSVNLGWEPQWVLFKRSSGATDNWRLLDNMRGWTNAEQLFLFPNTSGAESSSFSWGTPTATGMDILGSSGDTYIYIAIRRGPMKTPEAGTEVFSPVAYTSTNTDNRLVVTGILTDMAITRPRAITGSASIGGLTIDRLRGDQFLGTTVTNAETSNTTTVMTPTVGVGNAFSAMNGYGVGSNSTYDLNSGSQTVISWAFRRAPGFFDVVCYTGTGVARTVNHNLGVVPEMMVVKKRSSAEQWYVYASALGATKYVGFNNNLQALAQSTIWNNTEPTSSVFTLGTSTDINASATTFVWYGFATVAGVSKVGGYTGTGTTQQIDCGFSSGARFVLIKRTDSTGDWYVWDSARGIVAGNDPYLLLNSTAAEVTSTDYVDTYSAGFEITSTAPAAINANGGTFIFLAIA